MSKSALLASFLAVSAAAALAQGPSAAWRTVTTPHFRVHYTAPDEAWTLHVAGRLEAIRARVAAEVGYDPPQVTDVVVSDPVAQANGMALPLLDTPRMVLWTSPPGPESVIGNYTDWAELLVLHEDVHLAHLLRPARNPWAALAEKVLPLGPVTLKAPRWVHEGYATQLEGIMTASGRPNGDLRAAILRQRARAGRLPGYQAMSQDAESWLGMSMAYLMGSAYLEWLAERAGSDSMRKVWARLTARASRDFEAAFEGVYGDSPQRLYDRFRAELTWKAIEVERRLGSERREGEAWQDLAWTTGEPALSPDGTRLAIVLRARDVASRIVIWATGDDGDGEKKRRERIAKALARDSQDVAPVQAKPLAREAKFELPTTSGAEPSAVRFTPDGKALLFVRFEPDGAGFLHPDLFRWEFERGRVTRLTRGADVRDAAPAPDGRWAAAVRNRHGLSQLVRVDLASGEVSALGEARLDETYAAPRVSPDGGRLALLVHRGGRWHLVVRDLATRAEVELAVPAASFAAFPAWSPDGASVFASVGSGGLVDVVRLRADGSGVAEAVTRTAGAALAAAPTPDGREVFFLGLQEDGLDVRRLELGGHVEPATFAADVALAPATRPAPPPAPAPLATAAVAPGRPYGAGRQEFRALVGGTAAASGRAWEVGVRTGDVVGRVSAFAIAGWGGEGGPGGGAIAGAWRGWPLEVGVHAFSVRDRPSRQDDAAPAVRAGWYDLDRTGVEVKAAWRHAWRGAGLGLDGGVLWNRIGETRGDRVNQSIAFAGARLSFERTRTPVRLFADLGGTAAAGRTGDAGWKRVEGEATIGVSHKGNALALTYRRGGLGGAVSHLDLLQLGGTAGSLLPASALGARILDPALPAVLRTGSDHEGERAEVTLGGLPLFFARHRVWDRRVAPRGDWLRLVGVRFAFASEAIPLVKLPGFKLDLGAARILDEPLKDRTRWWLGFAYSP